MEWIGLGVLVVIVVVIYAMSARLQSRGMSASAGSQELAERMAERPDDGLAAPPFSTLVPPPDRRDDEGAASPR